MIGCSGTGEGPMTVSSMALAQPQWFRDAIEAIDAANSADPVTVNFDGELRAKELVHADRMGHWVLVLDPDAAPAQLIAARAHHLRRWVSPRTDYPEGRAGYLKWRSAQKVRQAEELRAILTDARCPDPVVAEAVAIVAKERLRSDDPRAQLHEDALCLVFMELQFDELALQLGEAKIIEVLRRTAAKMSEQALEAVKMISLSAEGKQLITKALSADESL